MSLRWSEAETGLMHQLVRDGVPRDQLPAHFPDRTIAAVGDKFAKMFPLLIRRDRREGKEIREAPPVARDQMECLAAVNQRQDIEFQKAMRRAIFAGLESAPIGIYKAPDADVWRAPPFVPHRDEARSLYSSSAALCADVG